ncbi:hypothetical protein [Pseudomonas sp. R5(2019)]|uniref:hypothetical protein n=1 Tax=Pseudomonas sp. R5(2019) TaxID=2697566 RepID=UPI00141244AE|nr:hypothetical protein [Pseudomonas sp. R5(2019)]NBA93986.1 hypothetical protein [Pseudomonas sp. R5(2019)]
MSIEGSETVNVEAEDKPAFFVVSLQKLLVMGFFTMGFYFTYCLYANWRNYKTATGAEVIPLLRALFAIFFLHSLFRKVDEKIIATGRHFAWSPNVYATLLVIVALISLIPQAHVVTALIFSLLCLIAIFYLWARSQQAINFCEGDPKAEANSAFTLANGCWIAVGALFWLSAFLPLFDI